MKLSSRVLHQWFPWIRRSLLVTNIVYLGIGVSFLAVSLWLYLESRKQFSGFDGGLKQEAKSSVFLAHQHNEAVRLGLYPAIIIIVVYGILFVLSGVAGFYGSLAQKIRPLLCFMLLASSGMIMTAVNSFFIYQSPIKSAGLSSHSEISTPTNGINLSGSMSFTENIQKSFKCCGLHGYEDWLLLQSKSARLNGLSTCCINRDGKNDGCFNDLNRIGVYEDKIRMSKLIHTEGCYIKIAATLDKISALHYVLSPVLLTVFTANLIGLNLSFFFCLILTYISGFNSIMSSESLSSLMFPDDEDEELE